MCCPPEDTASIVLSSSCLPDNRIGSKESSSSPRGIHTEVIGYKVRSKVNAIFSDKRRSLSRTLLPFCNSTRIGLSQFCVHHYIRCLDLIPEL